MMLSEAGLIDLRSSLLSTIEMLKRENKSLVTDIRNIDDKSTQFDEELNEDPSKDLSFFNNLQLTESWSGLSFKNISEEMVDYSKCLLEADVIFGNQECTLYVKFEFATKKVESIRLNMDEMSSLREIELQLVRLVKHLDLTGILNAISSFSRMHNVRRETIEELLTLYEDCFKVKTLENNNEEPEPEDLVIVAFDVKKHSSIFELSWILSWDAGKLSIVNQFKSVSLKGLRKQSKLRNLIDDLLTRTFIEADVTAIVDMWRKIGLAVANAE